MNTDQENEKPTCPGELERWNCESDFMTFQKFIHIHIINTHTEQLSENEYALEKQTACKKVKLQLINFSLFSWNILVWFDISYKHENIMQNDLLKRRLTTYQI